MEYDPHVETIQVVLDKGLLDAADRAARRTRQNRSALVRDALREHIERLNLRAREESDRRGYTKEPATNRESRLWEVEAAWPEE